MLAARVTTDWGDVDRLVSMAVFVKAADSGSFSAAGLGLGISSQMVGKHVCLLEERLGATLISRTTRRQSLTAIGQEYYRRCRIILAENEAADSLVNDLSKTPRGRLRVNAPLTFGTYGIGPLLPGFLRANPEILVELNLTDRYVNVVSEGFDVVARLGPLMDSSLIARSLKPYRWLPCASPAYLTSRGAPDTPDSLAGHDCVGFVNSAGVPHLDWRFSQGQSVSRVRISPKLMVNDQRVLGLAALEGVGIVLAAEVAVREHLSSGRLVHVLPNYEGPSEPMHLLFPSARAQPLRLRAFMDAVLGAFGPRAAQATP